MGNPCLPCFYEGQKQPVFTVFQNAKPLRFIGTVFVRLPFVRVRGLHNCTTAPTTYDKTKAMAERAGVPKFRMRLAAPLALSSSTCTEWPSMHHNKRCRPSSQELNSSALPPRRTPLR